MTNLEILADINKLDKWALIEIVESSHSVNVFIKNLKKELNLSIPEQLAKDIYIEHYQEYSRS